MGRTLKLIPSSVAMVPILDNVGSHRQLVTAAIGLYATAYLAVSNGRVPLVTIFDIRIPDRLRCACPMRRTSR